MNQELRFCTTSDGVRIAYAAVGDGPPLVKAANWLNHLEFDWKSPVWRHLLDALARDHRVLRYDGRGNGLSDWDVDDISFDAFVSDLESIVDAVGLERFALLGISQGCAISIAYAVQHPERVSHLILHGGYVQGWRKRSSPEELARAQAMLTLMREGWGRDNPAFRQLFTSTFLPDATPEQAEWFNELQRVTTSPENAVRIREATGLIDIEPLLGRVQMPTLVLHCLEDEVIPVREGRRLAAGIPNARFVPLESRNHLVMEQEAAWPVFLREVRAFLGSTTAEETGVPRSDGQTRKSGSGASASAGAGDRWSAVDALLDGALDQPPGERQRWLETACAGDQALLNEVRTLLELGERDDDLLKPAAALTGPVWEEVAEELAPGVHSASLRVGDVVGSYHIVASLGSGGMGQVFVAEDKKLGRQVALKVLPPEMDSPAHRKRFEREAKAVAALNHPNIVHLYSIEETDGVHFITMELVHGQTIAELVPSGGMELRKLLGMGVEIADAVFAAHEQGIIHRDLKPANVMVGEDGRVKVLDFGLAKPTVDIAASATREPSVDATKDGFILGTASYMSPEQAEGKELDPRTDVFSLGVMLYEMATGHRPFNGDTPASIISAILRDRPPEVTELKPELPRELGRIIKKCLAKDRSRRYQSVLDVRNDLDELRFQLDSRRLFRVATPRMNRSLVGVAIPVLAMVLIVVAGYLTYRSRELPAERQPTFTQLTSSSDEETFPSLSPDGRFVAYASRSTTDWDILLLRAGGQKPINLTASPGEDETQPAFSPDGEQIAFRSTRGGGGIFVMGATGEVGRRLTNFGWNPAWSPDGRKIAFATEAISRHPFDRPTRSELWLVDVESGKTERLFDGDGVQPSWSPHGDRVAFWGLRGGTGERDIYTISANGGEPRAVTADAAVDWNPVWSPNGEQLYFSSERGGSMNLWRVPIEESSGEVRGEPESITAPTSFASHLSISKNGRRIAYASSSIEHKLFAVDFDRDRASVVGEPRPIVPDLRDVDSPAPTPDGKSIIFSKNGMPEDVLITSTDTGNWSLLTNDPARDRGPVVSPDGTHIAFYSNRSGSYEIWLMRVDGSDLRQLTDYRDKNLHYPFWSPDGKRIGFSYTGTSGILLDVAKPFAEQTPEELPPFSIAEDTFMPLAWSPDGRYIAGHIFTAAGLRAGIATVELATGRWELVTNFGWFPAWMKDSRRIVFMAEKGLQGDGQRYLRDFALFVVDRSTGKYREVLSVDGASTEMPALSKDDRTLYFVSTRFESDIWMLSFEEPALGSDAPTMRRRCGDPFPVPVGLSRNGTSRARRSGQRPCRDPITSIAPVRYGISTGSP